MPSVGCKKVTVRPEGVKRKSAKQKRSKSKETRSDLVASSTLSSEAPVPSANEQDLKGELAPAANGHSKSQLNKESEQQREKKAGNGARASKITDYYPVRRSTRCTEKELKLQKQTSLEENIRNSKHDGLKVVEIDGKGRGVKTTRSFSRGEFVVEYAGELLDVTVAKQREKQYTEENKGCYIYYFSFKDKSYCIDATEESGLLGRLVNHSCKNFNCVTKAVEVDSKPRLVLIASRDIATDEEVLYDYGDRSVESLQAHPWLAL